MEDGIELLAKKKAPVIQGVAKLIAIRVGVRFPAGNSHCRSLKRLG
jgi:hypothetical protein